MSEETKDSIKLGLILFGITAVIVLSAIFPKIEPWVMQVIETLK